MIKTRMRLSQLEVGDLVRCCHFNKVHTLLIYAKAVDTETNSYHYLSSQFYTWSAWNLDTGEADSITGFGTEMVKMFTGTGAVGIGVYRDGKRIYAPK